MRLAKLPGALKPVIVAGEAHEGTVRRQLDAIGLEATIILEPEGRDSAPAVAVAAAYLLGVGQDGAAVMQPADHYIPDIERFGAAVERAAVGADDGYIVTFGITPSLPEVSYGYISIGDPLPAAPGVSKVSRFVEKPQIEKAIEYLAQGFVWNSGIFAFRPSLLLAEMEKFEPAIVDSVRRAIAEATITDNVIRLDPIAFARATKKSLDHAVMERTDKAAVVAGDFEWSDLGAWSAIYGAHPKDENGNVVAGGNAIAINSQNCFIRASDVPLAVIGLSDVGVIAEPDGIVVCKLDTSASVKIAVENLRAKARPEALRSTPAGRRRDHASLSGAARSLGAWLDNAAIPLWWTAGADHDRGGFFEVLDERGRGVRMARRMRVQARQVYVYAAAGMAGWQGPWRSAARHGLDYLHEHFRRPDGLYCTLVGDDGGQVDERAFLYDQAFMLLALATAAGAGIDARQCTDEATAIRATLLADFARPSGGGFLEEEIRGARFQSNPHMHLLEAALAWSGFADDGEWSKLAEQIVRLCLGTFIDPGAGMLREFFADSGAPLDGFPGRIVEPGHQFEWAWLLWRWAARNANEAARASALKLFEIGERHGIDPLRGVAIDVLLDDMSPYSRQARLWPQTERLKAALVLARASDAAERAKFEASALSAAEGLSHYLQTEVHGLWHDKMRADGTFVIEPSPASSLYHIAAAVQALRDYGA